MIRQRPFNSPFSQNPPFYDAGLGVWSAAPLNYTPPPPLVGNNLIWGSGNFLIWGLGYNLVWGTA